MYGYWGKILRVDLGAKKVTEDRVDKSFFKKYLGGVGIAARIIYDEVGGNVDPLSSDNVIVFGVGPFQGFSIPGSGRWIVASKSPLTGIWADSCGGGTWANDFKHAGFDAIAIKGRADSPVYLWIHDGEAEIRDASGIWGKTTSETDKEIKKDLGEPKVKIACIGPAGENLVRFANIVNEHGVAGRAGLGAVMGSKKLKAIATRGEMLVEAAEPDELRELSKGMTAKASELAEIAGFRKLGTVGGMEQIYRRSEGPLKYWTKGAWEKISSLHGPLLNYILSMKPVACTSCPVACHKISVVKEPEKYVYRGFGPEYETVAMLGPNLLIDDPKAIGYMGHLCDEYGMDTIEMGGLLGLCTESYEKGWIDKADLDGIELEWGNADAMISIINQTIKREGFGDVLAKGIRKTATTIGKGAPEIAQHVKGLGIPAHDPRSEYLWSVNYATGTRGACHTRGFSGLGDGIIAEWGVKKREVAPSFPRRFVMDKVGFITAKYQNWAVLFNSLVQCMYMAFGETLTDQLKLLNFVTGWDVDIEGLEVISERIFTLQRMFDIRCGVSRRDDILPRRMFEPLEEGGAAGMKPEPFDRELLDYYRLRGWNSDGKPTKEKLTELGLA